MIPSLILVTVMIHTMNTQSTPSSIPIPAVATIAGAPAAFGPLPSARQMRWHAMESCMFIHFGVNTFTGAEWGGGKENPTLFNPTKLDCLQWAGAAKDAGLRGIIITAKHHDGFCLWPSAVTEHSVKSSPWRDGKGDVLRDLSAACRAEGLAFGVYLSPWDRNNPKYGSGEAYNEYFASQLKDVLSNYGEVSEVWFDGACGEGPDGRKQVYDFPKFIDVVRTCQPGACIFSDGGPDVRWVGNESGFGSETNWSRMNAKEFFPGVTGRNDDLEHGQRDGTDWLPAEVDVSIRPGWFWRAAEDDRVK
ncbi:MAG: alpha-L-fucosidase, partial [Planctomycetota bacterium]